MNKKAISLKLEPELLEGLDRLQGQLEHRPTRTTLIENAIRDLLERHRIKVREKARQ